MLTARPAFGRATTADTLVAILEHDPDWECLPPNLPVSMRRVLHRCLEKDPEEFTSARLSASNRRRVPGVAIVVLALEITAAVVAWFVRPSADVAERRVVEITTPWTSDLWSFAVSPDGRRIAYVADHDGQPMLWVRTLDTAGAQVLPGTERARGPFWSPDSRSIGFFADSDLKRIEARG